MSSVGEKFLLLHHSPEIGKLLKYDSGLQLLKPQPCSPVQELFMARSSSGAALRCGILERCAWGVPLGQLVRAGLLPGAARSMYLQFRNIIAG